MIIIDKEGDGDGEEEDEGRCVMTLGEFKSREVKWLVSSMINDMNSSYEHLTKAKNVKQEDIKYKLKNPFLGMSTLYKTRNEAKEVIRRMEKEKNMVIYTDDKGKIMKPFECSCVIDNDN